MRVIRFCCALAVLVACDLANANWIDFEKDGGIAYFLESSPARISRYDLSSERFLSPINLGNFGMPTAMEVDSDGIYMAFGRNVSRFNLNGGGRVNLSNSAENITDIVSSELNIYAYYQKNLISISKGNNQSNGVEDYFYSMRGLSYSNIKKRLFARSSGVSPSDILYINLPDDGSQPTTYLAQTDSPYHGDYPSGSATYLFPQGERVVDDAGVIYTTDSLTYVGSFGGGFDHIDFYQGLPILLRDNELLAFNAAYIETGRATFDSGQAVSNIAVFGENVFGFSLDASGQIVAQKFATSELDLADPGEPVDPNNLAFEPDKIIVSDDGVIYLLSSANLSIFRWSIDTKKYLETIPLRSVPKYMALSEENRSLYVGYSNGSITAIDLDADLVEKGLVNLPTQPLGLETAGEYIFAVDYSGAWESHWIFSAEGELLSQKEWNYPSREYIWNTVNRRFYHFRDGSSPNDLHWEEINVDGTIGSGGDSPYHSSSGIQYPIRVSPDGSRVILGSGRIYDGLSLTYLNSLANNIVDAVWYGNELFTFKASSDSVLQKWSPAANYDLTEELEFTGRPLRLLKSSSNNTDLIVLISDLNGKPHFRVFPFGRLADLDADGIPNDEDNCELVHNPLQEDSSGDGTGDACVAEDDDFLLSLMPSIAAIAARNRLPDPEWGAFNTLCCPSSTSILTLTIDGETSVSEFPSCEADATFNGYIESEPGEKLVSGSLNASACGFFDFSFSVGFEPAKRYVLISDLEAGQPTIEVVEFDVAD